MTFRKIAALLLAVFILSCFAGCSGTPKEETPTTITVWHVYGGQTDSPLNDLIDEFNQTVGKERQINVQVTSVSNSNTIHELVLAAANGEPGASELPDIFSSYPKTVMALPDDGILVDYRDYFSEEELSAFIPAFVEEGTVNDRLVVLPVENLYLVLTACQMERQENILIIRSSDPAHDKKSVFIEFLRHPFCVKVTRYPVAAFRFRYKPDFSCAVPPYACNQAGILPINHIIYFSGYGIAGHTFRGWKPDKKILHREHGGGCQQQCA